MGLWFPVSPVSALGDGTHDLGLLGQRLLGQASPRLAFAAVSPPWGRDRKQALGVAKGAGRAWGQEAEGEESDGFKGQWPEAEGRCQS